MKTSNWKPKLNDQDKAERTSTDNQPVAIHDQNTNSAFSLQRSLGNQATKELYMANSDAFENRLSIQNSFEQPKNFQLKSLDAPRQHRVQAKLHLSEPGDKYEQEAVRVADQVMRGDKLNGKTFQPKLQIKERTTLDREPAQTPTGINSEFVTRLNRTQSQGYAIDESVRHTIERQMPFNFDKVRVHTDSNAAQMSQTIGARAFTNGQDIYFGAGQYRPDTQRGRHLLVHELTHTVQQRNSTSAVKHESKISSHSGSANKIVARQTQSGSRRITQTDYDAAVSQLQNRSPSLIYQYFNGRQIGRRSQVEVFTVPHPSPSPPLISRQFCFHLSVETATGTSGPAAFFRPIPETLLRPSPQIERVNQILPITLNMLDAGDTVNDLAAWLYHEGVHMLLHRDRLLSRLSPRNQTHQSGLLQEFERDNASATAFPGYSQLLDRLVNFIRQFSSQAGSPRSHATARQDALLVLETVIEERFTHARENAAFPARTPSPIRGQTVSNLRTGLNRVGVPVIGHGAGALRRAITAYPDLRDIILGMVGLVQHIAQSTASTQSTGRGSTQSAQPPTGPSSPRPNPAPSPAQQPNPRIQRKSSTTGPGSAAGNTLAFAADAPQIATNNSPAKTGPQVSTNVESSIQQQSGQGQPLSDSIRLPLEHAFNASFDSVRIHTNSVSNDLNRTLNARAFTTGEDIFFAQNQYTPESPTGKRLLAHELTHVLQQRNAPLNIVSRQTDSPDERPPLETRVENAITRLRSAGSNLNTQRQQDLLSATVSVLSEFIPQGFGTKDAQGTVQNASRSVPVRQPVETVGDYMHQVTLFLSQENRGSVAGQYIGQQGQGAIILYAPNIVNASDEDIAETLVHETVHLFSDILRRAVIWARQQRRTGTPSPAPTSNSSGSLSLSIQLAGLRASNNRQVEEAILRLGSRYQAIIRFINLHRSQRGSEPLDVISEAAHWASVTLDEMLAYVFAERVVEALTSQPRPRTQPSGPTGIVSIFDPTRFFYAYALDHWVSDSDDRSRLESPEGRQVMQRVGQSRELESLYTFVMQWINRT